MAAIDTYANDTTVNDGDKVIGSDSGNSDVTRNYRMVDISTYVRDNIVAGDIPNLDADKITTGVFNINRIPDFDADKITSGSINSERIPNLSASKITSGVFNRLRLSSDTPTDGQVLSWQNSDSTMQWVDQSAGSSYTDADAVDALEAAATVIPTGVWTWQNSGINHPTFENSSIARIDLIKTGSLSDGNTVAEIEFGRDDDEDNETIYGQIAITAPDVTDSSEDGLLKLGVIRDGAFDDDYIIADGGNDRIELTRDVRLSGLGANANSKVVGIDAEGDLSVLTATSGRTALGLGPLATLTTGITTTNINGSALSTSSELTDDSDATIPTTSWVKDQGYASTTADTAPNFGSGIRIGDDDASHELDVFEFGSWTPAMTYGNNAITETIAEGEYVRIGDLVSLTGYVDFAAITDNTNTIRLTNLPFSIDNSIGNQTGVIFTVDGTWISGTAKNSILTTESRRGFFTNSGTTILNLQKDDGNGAVTPSNLSLGRHIRFRLIYHTS